MLPTEEFLTRCEKYEYIFPDRGDCPSSVNGYFAQYNSHKFLLLHSVKTEDRGALGRADIDAICHILDVAEKKKLPVVFYLDSSGAKLDEGVAIQASFRKLLFKGMKFSRHGGKLIFLMGRNVFGGASIFSMCGHARLYSPGTRISMTGPRVLEKYNECNYEKIREVISSERRAEQDLSACWISDSREAEQKIELLFSNPDMTGVYNEVKTVSNITVGHKVSERVVIHDDSIMCLGNRPPSAIDLLSLAAIIEQWSFNKNIIINCEWESHSILIDDETAYQSRMLFLLSNKIYEKNCNGFNVEIRIDGEISGGLYIALAAASQVFSITNEAKVYSLPSIIIDIIKSDNERKETKVDLLKLGVVDKYTGVDNE